MTTYIPTKEELIGLNFEYSRMGRCFVHKKYPIDIYLGNDADFYIGNRPIFPRSLSDLQTLITLFTPNP